MRLPAGLLPTTCRQLYYGQYYGYNSWVREDAKTGRGSQDRAKCYVPRSRANVSGFYEVPTRTHRHSMYRSGLAIRQGMSQRQHGGHKSGRSGQGGRDKGSIGKGARRGEGWLRPHLKVRKGGMGKRLTAKPSCLACTNGFTGRLFWHRSRIMQARNPSRSRPAPPCAWRPQTRTHAMPPGSLSQVIPSRDCRAHSSATGDDQDTAALPCDLVPVAREQLYKNGGPGGGVNSRCGERQYFFCSHCNKIVNDGYRSMRALRWGTGGIRYLDLMAKAAAAHEKPPLYDKHTGRYQPPPGVEMSWQCQYWEN